MDSTGPDFDSDRASNAATRLNRTITKPDPCLWTNWNCGQPCYYRRWSTGV